MSHDKKKTVRNAVCIIVSFILSIILTMLSYISGTTLGMFNTRIIVNSLDNETYYKEIINYTVETSENFSILLGLPDEVFDEVFQIGETRTEVLNFVNSTIEGKDYTPNTDNAKARLVNNINKCVVDGGYEINEEQQKSVDNFAKDVCQVYSDSMKIPFFKYFVSVRNVVNDVVKIAIPILVIFGIVAIVILVRMDKWLHRGLRYICYSTIATAIMTAVLPIYLLSQGIYKRIAISPKYVYDFIVAHVSNSLKTFLWAAGVFALMSLVLIVVIIELKKKYKKKSKEN